MADCVVQGTIDFGKGPVEVLCVRKDRHTNNHRFEDPEPDLNILHKNVFKED